MDFKKIFSPANFFDLKDFQHKDLFLDLSYVWEVLEGRIPRYLKEVNSGEKPIIKGNVSSSAYLEGVGITIEEGAVVEPGAYIKGPAFIGKGTEVRHGAYIRGHVITGEGCVIGHATEVKNSIFLNGAKAGHFAYVGDSILGNSVNLGAGTKIANLKMSQGSIKFKVDGQILDSGLRKLGAILGDGVETGCNSVTNPGLVLAPGSLVYPCASVKGVHLKETRLK